MCAYTGTVFMLFGVNFWCLYKHIYICLSLTVSNIQICKVHPKTLAITFSPSLLPTEFCYLEYVKGVQQLK